MTMTVPDGQQLTFEAKDATEFRALLGRVLDASPLSCGQIAIKTGMPRSTAYSLRDTKRPGLPSNPEQVIAFVRACGLTTTQTELVMDLWEKLQQEAEDIRTSDGKEATTPTSNPVLIDQDMRQELAAMTLKSLREHGFLSEEEAARVNPFVAPVGGKRPSRRNVTSWTDLLQYVLAAEDRTRRAVLLLIPITVLLLGIMTALVYLAVRTPMAAPFVVAGLFFGPVTLLTRRNLRRAKTKTTG
ncbi:hypothetical protein AB0N89_40800 [Amycolatopsis sp. NPDC089917]|uniref:hypothetical protein n=1 Tax=Amycolatopsis sp. NPDC089917 TaxID=3155187 RepID=UPI003420B400